MYSLIKYTGQLFPKKSPPYGCQPKNSGFYSQIIHLFIGFSIIFTIHFGVPVFLETPILIKQLSDRYEGSFRKSGTFPSWASKRGGVAIGHILIEMKV